jgi:serine/threonine protein kinase
VDVIGTHFGSGFQVLREIGRGAVAWVFLASDGRAVKALKLFPPEHRGRATRELDVGHGLEHPHLNPVEALVEVAGYPGVVMPLVPGVRLGGWLRARPGRSPFIDTMMGVLDGLDSLHGSGVVHRDVKPENILVEGSGHARLLDYDLSVRVGEARETRAVAGTVAYLSPEQTRAQAVTPASDLYAVGILLYWGLTGQVPFTGSVQEVIEAHRSEPPVAASRLDAGLAPFDVLLRRLLAKDAAARYQRAGEVAQALGAARREAGLA